MEQSTRQVEDEEKKQRNLEMREMMDLKGRELKLCFSRSFLWKKKGVSGNRKAIRKKEKRESSSRKKRENI